MAQYHPKMPDFPTSLAELIRISVKYTQEKRPMDLFFEFYIVDVIGLLPAETVDAIDAFDKKFPVFGGNWKNAVTKELHLSSTIDVAILDLWYRNKAIAEKDRWSYHPWHFAMHFKENYLKRDSQVDIWNGDALAQAKARIVAARIQEQK